MSVRCASPGSEVLVDNDLLARSRVHEARRRTTTAPNSQGENR